MISLTCTKCQAVLEMDDAFAGGVCRCEHCGTIQTVPSHLKGKGTSASGKKSGKALYSKSHREDGVPSSGLDQIAQVVASSGLSSGLLSRVPKKWRTNQLVVFGLGAVLALGLMFAGGAWFASQGSGRHSAGAGPEAILASAVPGGKVPVVASVAAPAFCGMAISDRVVIYVLDRGSGTGELFSYLKEAAFKSVESLGEQRRFQIIFWNNGSDDAFPSSAPTFATTAAIEAARRALDGIFAHGQSDAGSALNKAVAAGPDSIILATGKGGQLNDEFVKQVMAARGARPIRIHTFDLGGGETSAAMKSIAERTGGSAHKVSDGDLKRFSRE